MKQTVFGISVLYSKFILINTDGILFLFDEIFIVRNTSFHENCELEVYDVIYSTCTD